MKRLKLIQLWFLFLLCIGFAVWAPYASAQQTKPAEEVVKEMEKAAMPILKGEQWLKLDTNSKVAFIWGAGHVVLIENILMEKIPELKVENFSAKVLEARLVDVRAGKEKTINQIVSKIDQFYKDHPDKLGAPVMLVIWAEGVLPNLKTGVAGRPLQ